MTATVAYMDHLQSSSDLVTTYAARRAGFVALALEKNRKATPHVEEARALYEAASNTRTPSDLLNIAGIEAGLLAAAGLSDKSLKHLQQEDKLEAINGLIKNFLEPAGDRFVEELVYRFLLTRGDTLGGSMRNVGGILAQRKLSRAIISTLTIGGKQYQWLHSRTMRWTKMSVDDTGIELFLRGLNWKNQHGTRILIYNLNVPLVKNNVDLCLFSQDIEQIRLTKYSIATTYVALGELKGGVDPAGADEHWKTARTALERIRVAFSRINLKPHTFFIGAAIERKMANEIWLQLETRELSNAANLNESNQLASISRWLCNL
jgi:type II restriction enzyme